MARDRLLLFSIRSAAHPEFAPAEIGQREGRAGEEGGVDWHVLADPEGNVFCLLESRVDPL